MYWRRCHLRGSLRIFFVWCGMADMVDAEIDSLSVFEENLYNLPLSQEGHNESSGQPHFAAFSDSVPATPSVMEDSTDSVLQV